MYMYLYIPVLLFHCLQIFFTTDIDECLEKTDNCSQMCTNTEGNFTCGCDDGYLLGSDGTTCNGMDLEYTCI